MALVTGKAVKEASQRFVDEFRQNGAAFIMPHYGVSPVVLVGGQPGLSILNVTPDERAKRVFAKTVTAKTFREFLYEKRNERVMAKPGAVVWVIYDAGRNLSFMGLGVVTRTKVAEKMVARCPHCSMVEVKHGA